MAQTLEHFLDWKKLSRLGFWDGETNQVAGVDIGSSSVKVVQLRKDKGRAILETYGEIASGPYRGLAVGQAAALSPEKLVDLIRDLFQEANVTAKNACLSVPLGSSLLKIIRIPKVEEALLSKVVPIEARKYVPVPVGEVALDWWILPRREPEAEGPAGEQTLEILLVAIHSRIINQYQELAQAAGLKLVSFELETFSAIRSVFGGEMAPTVILDLGAATTKMAIVDYGVIRLSHSITKGAQDVTLAISRSLGVDFAKAEEIKRKVGLVERLEDHDIAQTVNNIVEYIFLEVNKAITVYQEKNRRAVSKIILIGGGSLLKGLLPLAAKNFEVPVSLGKPFEKTETPAFLADILNEAGSGFAVATGLALRRLEELE